MNDVNSAVASVIARLLSLVEMPDKIKSDSLAELEEALAGLDDDTLSNTGCERLDSLRLSRLLTLLAGPLPPARLRRVLSAVIEGSVDNQPLAAARRLWKGWASRVRGDWPVGQLDVFRLLDFYSLLSSYAVPDALGDVPDHDRQKSALLNFIRNAQAWLAAPGREDIRGFAQPQLDGWRDRLANNTAEDETWSDLIGPDPDRPAPLYALLARLEGKLFIGDWRKMLSQDDRPAFDLPYDPTGAVFRCLGGCQVTGSLNPDIPLWTLRVHGLVDSDALENHTLRIGTDNGQGGSATVIEVPSLRAWLVFQLLALPLSAIGNLDYRTSDLFRHQRLYDLLVGNPCASAPGGLEKLRMLHRLDFPSEASDVLFASLKITYKCQFSGMLHERPGPIPVPAIPEPLFKLLAAFFDDNQIRDVISDNNRCDFVFSNPWKETTSRALKKLLLLVADPTRVLIINQSGNPVLTLAREAVVMDETNHTVEEFYFLHISDLHFGGYGGSIPLLAETMESGFERLIKSLPNKLNNNICGLIVSGDIADKTDAGGYAKAGEFFAHLMEKFNLKKEDILLIPGNHDIDTGKEEYATRSQGAEYTVEGALAVWTENGTVYYQNPSVFERFHKYAAFHEKMTGQHFSDDPAQQVVLTEFPQAKTVFVGLNTAWRIGDKYRKANLHEDACSTALSMLQNADWTGWLKVLVIHHPVTSAGPNDRAVTNPQLIEGFLAAGVTLVLCGDIHGPELTMQRPPWSGGQEMPMLSAGTLYGEPAAGSQQGFNVLCWRPTERQLTVHRCTRGSAEQPWLPVTTWHWNAGTWTQGLGTKISL